MTGKDDMDGVVFAADLETLDANRRVIEKIRGHISAVKLPNFLIFSEAEKHIEQFCSDINLPVFFDTKIADVPHTNFKITQWCKGVGASAVSVHGFVGHDGVMACLDAAGGMRVVVQTELTSPGGEVFNTDVTLSMARMAAGLGADAFQAPGNRPERIGEIREIVGSTAFIVCCGVGAQGGTPSSAYAAGANAVIVGRKIYTSDDPAAAVKAILET